MEVINLPGSGVEVTGTAQVGETLTADVTNISDPNGFFSVTAYLYQWFRSDGLTDTRIGGATSSTYDPVADDVGKTLKVQVNYRDLDGLRNYVDSDVTATVNGPATGAPSIQGILQKDKILTADTVGIADLNGPASPTYTYQWIRVNGMTENDISAATASTYTLTQDDVDERIKLNVTFTDSDNFPESVTSAATPVIVAENGTRRLIWLGTMTVGESTDVVFGNPVVQQGFYFPEGFGGLSPAAFSHGSSTYTFVEIRSVSAESARYLNVEFSPALPEPNIAEPWHVTPDTGENV